MLLLVAGVAGCATATPVVLQSGQRPDLSGHVETTGGYTGVIVTDSRLCTGSFTGMIGQTAVPLEVSCTDGRTGVGRAILSEGSFVSGEVRLNDGSRLTIRPSGPAAP